MNNPNALIGTGGAPTRATTFPKDSKGRKARPVASGVLDYFPDAIVALAEVSWTGNEQHNPGQPLHWARAKSGDEGDALMRHFLQRGTVDDDGILHSAKVAWRALAMLQKEIEAMQKLAEEDLFADIADARRIDRLNGHTQASKEVQDALSRYNHGEGKFEDVAPLDTPS